ncbi:MAG: type I pullulanase, partial [Eubacterium sp.]|nr:type I pullulanase [Eubacterium sp.]
MKAENRITYSKDFDNEFSYDGKDLGAACSKEKTVFKLWSPLADKVTLYLYPDGNGDTEEKKENRKSVEMEPEEKGVWRKEISGDLHGTYYTYEIVRGNEVIETADPYAVSCGCNGMRSMVTDLRRTDPDGFALDTPPALGTEQIIYELHVKDFSHDPDSGVPEEFRGKYKAFTVTGINGDYPTCVDYLKDLGVTHVHLLPFYDFAALDESGADDQFNWGYDPLNYNVPEGSFATDPYEGSVRVRECKEMIQSLHKAGIRVVMDVVYNHTYSEDSWLERTVPGYYCRRWQDGTLSDGSACGSDMAVGRAMVDNYIADSVMYWAKEYHIDGFRFDLMGLLTTELMNRIRKEMDETFGKGQILLYGEPWRAAESPMEEGTHAALKDNIEYLDENVAVFSDDIRDVVKGHVFYAKEPGFVNGAKGLEQKVLFAASAFRKGGSCIVPKSSSQIVSYVSAHDNFTLWDKLVLTMHDVENAEAVLGDETVFAKKHEDILAANKLAALMYFTCQGHIFFQAGEEFGRTKLGDENSYRSDPKINMLRWKQTVEFEELVSYYKGLIRLRKKLPGLYDKSSSAYVRVCKEKVHKDGVVSFTVDNSTEDKNQCSPWKELYIAFNASKETEYVSVPEGDWFVLADDK